MAKDTDRVTERRASGAHSLGDDAGGRRKGLAWLWALLALALIAAAALFLLARNAWDEGDDAGIDLTNEPSRSGEDADDATTDERGSGDAGDDQGGTGAPSTTANGGSSATTDAGSVTTRAGPTTTAVEGGDGAGADSSLTADGEALLPLPAAGLAASSGQTAQATSVVVESVVSDEGFWVGDSADERVFVRLNTGGAESPVQIEKGSRVSFTGTVTPTPADVSTFGITPEEGADLLTEQGQYIAVELDDIQQG